MLLPCNHLSNYVLNMWFEGGGKCVLSFSNMSLRDVLCEVTSLKYKHNAYHIVVLDNNGIIERQWNKYLSKLWSLMDYASDDEAEAYINKNQHRLDEAEELWR